MAASHDSKIAGDVWSYDRLARRRGEVSQHLAPRWRPFSVRLYDTTFWSNFQINLSLSEGHLDLHSTRAATRGNYPNKTRFFGTCRRIDPRPIVCFFKGVRSINCQI